VVIDGTDLDDAAMQRFAQWTNLSETTFLLPPTEADGRLPRAHLHGPVASCRLPATRPSAPAMHGSRPAASPR
jgi:hypothetical protein